MMDPRPIFDFHINLGSVIVSLVGLLLSWMAHKIYKRLADFLNEHRQHGERLEDAEVMVDRHSRAMMKQGMLGLRVQQLHRTRRRDDASFLDMNEDVRT